MKALKILSVTLLLSLTLPEIFQCDAQDIDIMKSIGIVVKVARDKLQPLLEKHNRTLEDPNVPINIMYERHASKCERYIQTIDRILTELVRKKQKVNKQELVLDGHFKHDLDNYNEQLSQYKRKLEVFIWGKDHSFDLLEHVKKNADVCKDKMTQMQLIDGFRDRYIDAVSRYLIAKHIIISLWETMDNTKDDDKKAELNSEVRKSLLTYGKRFEELMATSSREYQHCTNPSNKSQYIMHQSARQSAYCYQTEKGSLSKKIVAPDTHRDKSMQPCYDYVSIRAAKARPGYVVVGASIERICNILYIRILEGKLLPNGMIDSQTITYNEDPAPGTGDEVVQLHYRDTPFDITETVAPDDRVITGLKFAQSADKHVYLEVITQKLDVDKGILIENTSRSEPHKSGLTQFQIRKFDQRHDKISKNLGIQSVQPNQYVKFTPGGRLQFHPFIELGDVHPTPFTMLSGASLYVREVSETQGYLSIRLHNFNIVPHVAKIDFEINEDFADVLKSI